MSSNRRIFPSFPPEHKLSFTNLVIGCFILILFIITLSRNEIKQNHVVSLPENDFYFFIKLDDETKAILIINKTSKQLSNLKFIFPNKKTYEYDLSDSALINQALAQCTHGSCGNPQSTPHRRKLTRNHINLFDCIYYTHVNAVRFCFNNILCLTHVVLLNQVSLSLNDVSRLRVAFSFIFRV